MSTHHPSETTGHASFVVTGDFLMQTARTLVLSERPDKAWRLLADSLVGPGSERVTRRVLEGRMVLTGDSAVGIEALEPDGHDDHTKAYLDDLDYIYAGRVRINGAWHRPCAVVVDYGTESGRWASKGDSDRYRGPGSALRAWTHRRGQFFCAPQELAEIVEADFPDDGLFERRRHVIWEPCGEPPFWLDSKRVTLEDAVNDALRAGRRLDRRGEWYAPLSPTQFARAVASEGDLNRDEADEMMEKARAAEDELREAELERIATEVRRRAGDDTFELTLLDGRKIEIPRAPFVNYALHRTSDAHMAPEWDPVSPCGLKMPMDDPYHTDWVLGAGIALEESYEDNVKLPAWDEVGRLQALYLDMEATVVVRAGVVSGAIGKEILVLPNLSPKHTAQFLGAKGVITEVGGQLAHLATVGRERGITTMRVKNACEIYRDGMRVTLDPDSGRIEHHDDPDTETQGGDTRDA